MLTAVVAWSLAFAPLMRAEEPSSATSPGPHVRLIVDFGDDVELHFTRLPWRMNMTAWDAVVAATKHPRGLQVKHRGTGETLLVQDINDVANEGGQGRNWIFRVNDEVAKRSAGITPVEPGQVVRWSFETYP